MLVGFVRESSTKSEEVCYILMEGAGHPSLWNKPDFFKGASCRENINATENMKCLNRTEFSRTFSAVWFEVWHWNVKTVFISVFLRHFFSSWWGCSSAPLGATGSTDVLRNLQNKSLLLSVSSATDSRLFFIQLLMSVKVENQISDFISFPPNLLPWEPLL